ncbi:tetratricopeptide repeat protein [candidate division TA06 bacterium]|uniref:Tetratricopeptide repeat protein n=1 Tax=candidate division TA06 bacterium TaxID=2250710 RepID=A0A933MJA1_UNCT6|nr:tetratricopeptide repeat protein [candidate division TA06 bacterium]
MNAAVGDDFDARIDRGLEILYQGQYQEAIDTFDVFISQHPKNPAGYFFKAGAYQLRSMSYETQVWDDTQALLLDSSLELSHKAVNRDRRDPWAFFIRGGTYAYRAAIKARAKDYFSALSNGLSAVSDLNKAAALDPQLYDAYLGIGSFHYFRTKAASILKWLPFIGDNREKGIAEIKTAMEKGRYSKVLAQNGLAWIYLDYEKYPLALEQAQQLEKSFPQNHIFFWIAPEVYRRTKQWDKGSAGYARLLKLLDQSQPMNNFNRVFVGSRLAKCYYQEKKYREALEASQKALGLALDERSAQRLKYERGRAFEVLKQAQKKLKISQ